MRLKSEIPPCVVAAACLLIFVCSSACAQQPDFATSRPTFGPMHTDFVTFAKTEPVSVAANKAAIIPLRFRVTNGMHINSHLPGMKELIPTQLAVAQMPGINVVSVDFPAGTEYSVAYMPKKKLSVYSGDFVLQAHLVAKPGTYAVGALLRYQACDATSCYPPKTVPVLFQVVSR